MPSGRNMLENLQLSHFNKSKSLLIRLLAWLRNKFQKSQIASGFSMSGSNMYNGSQIIWMKILFLSELLAIGENNSVFLSLFFSWLHDIDLKCTV